MIYNILSLSVSVLSFMREYVLSLDEVSLIMEKASLGNFHCVVQSWFSLIRLFQVSFQSSRIVYFIQLHTPFTLGIFGMIYSSTDGIGREDGTFDNEG